MVTQGTQAATCMTMKTVASGQPNADDIAAAISGMKEMRIPVIVITQSGMVITES